MLEFLSLTKINKLKLISIDKKNTLKSLYNYIILINFCSSGVFQKEKKLNMQEHRAQVFCHIKMNSI